MIHLLLTWLASPLLWLRAALPHGRGEPEDILLMQTAKIGDFICTTPLFRELKRSFPRARLHVLMHGVNEPLARHNPHIDEILVIPPGGLQGWRGRRWLYRLLRQRSIDTFVCVSPNLVAWQIPFWAGVPRRLSVVPNYGGSSYRWARPFLTAAETHRQGRLLLETEFRLLARLGVRPESQAKDAFAAAGSEEVAARLLPPPGKPLIGLGMSSGNKLKELGEARLVELAAGLLVAIPESLLVLVGGPADRELAGRVAATLPPRRVVDTTGQLGLEALPALLRRLQLYVGVDSGITYLADACGVPVVDLMGPADADDQRPTGPAAVVLRPQLPCAPCSHAFRAPYHCQEGTRACMAEFPLATVIGAASRLINKKE